MNNILIIYHKNCNDGFGAALTTWLKFGPNAEYYPANHHSKPPDVTGKTVFICDFSYKKEQLLVMIEQAISLTVIDHHLSAEKELESIPDKYKIFDMNHSGAYLTWKYFFPNTKVPLLIQYIEDRDIWINSMENTFECFYGLCELPKSFKIWKKYLDDNNIDELIDSGKIIHKHNSNLIQHIIKSGYVKSQELLDGKTYNIAYLNSNVLKSDLGNYLIEKLFNEADFSAIYHYDGNFNKTHFSLRSKENKADVSAIATLYGGGGHKYASGITFDGQKLCFP